MVERQICAKIVFCTTEELEADEKMLVEKAKSACDRAYAPYSRFQVGAAVLLANGEVFEGSNQENAAYPSGLCAERTAVFYANSARPDVPVKTIAVAARNENGFLKEVVAPCGACRQVLSETENRFGQPVRILLYGTDQVAVLETVKSLLPLSFGVESLFAG